MASNINATKPTTGSPTTQSVRDNFSAAKEEINSLLRSSLDVVTTAGTGTLYTANFTNNVVLTEGLRVIVKAHTANTGSITYINMDSTGPYVIKNMNGSDLVVGEIAGANHYLDLVYNSSNQTWVLLNPSVVLETAAQLLAKIKTVDGTGSGLDADSVDGKHIAIGTGSNSNTIYFQT
jgi:hypothetical protein